MKRIRSSELPRRRRRNACWFSLSWIALCCALGCAKPTPKSEPRVVEQVDSADAAWDSSESSLSAESREVLGDDADVALELEVTLNEWFGELFDPHYALLPEWRDVGFDPNTSPFEGARSFEGIDASDLENLRVGNREHWASTLAAVDANAQRLPGPWPGRRDLNATWRELRDNREMVGVEAFQVEARRLFEEDYPTSADTARLYARTCQQCHGMTGAGDGPMSNMMEPRPRDYRHGVFKFSSVNSPARPRRDDLRRTVEHGLPGTQMAAWRELLGTGEREALIDRVRWMAIRGEVERWLVASWIADDERPSDEIEDAYRTIWERWLTAEDHFVALQDPVPPSTAAAIERGDRLFHDAARGNCASCHGDNGRGDGPSAVEVTPDGVRHPLLLDEWGRPAWPSDLRAGIFRGGSRPIDIYRRVHCGIHGTPMPAQAGTLSQDEIWDVVHYVRSIAGLK